MRKRHNPRHLRPERTMKRTRREALEAAGIVAGSCALSSCAVDKLATVSDGARKHDLPWTYRELEPDSNAQRAYHIYTELPVYIPKKPTYNIDIPKSISASVLCHVSVTKWCKISGHKAFSDPQKERCKRLAADTAGKTVELLNAHFVGRTSATPQVNEETKQCRLCHTRDSGPQNFSGKMICTSCHSVNLDKHP